jgi:hypothetical protein
LLTVTEWLANDMLQGTAIGRLDFGNIAYNFHTAILPHQCNPSYTAPIGDPGGKSAIGYWSRTKS